MPISNNLNNLEFDKFGGTTPADTYVRTQGVATIAPGAEVSVVGLKTAQRITTLNVTDVAAPIPSTPLSGRNMISVQNKSEVDTIYIGNSDVIASDDTLGTTAGWEVGPGESLNELIQDDIILYAVAKLGKTILTKVREIA